MQRISMYHVFAFALGLIAVRSLSAGQPTKASVPDDASQKAAAAQVGEIYKPDYAKAKTPIQKVELARKLLKEGQGTKDDLVARFVLMRIARDIAAQQGDLGTAFEAIDLIESDYEIDAIQMRLDTAATAVKAAKSPIASKLCIDLLRPLIEQLTVADRYDDAKQLSELALTAARGTRDTSLVKDITAQAKELESIAASYRKLKEYQTRLETKATDPEANLEIGKFFCFVKGDWERGVSLLALSSDVILRKLAAAELEESIDFIEAGDGWWDYGEELPAISRRAVRQHASALYSRVVSTLVGLSKTRIEQRLTEVQWPPYGKPIVNSIGMELKQVPSGTFMMGIDNRDTIARPYEVTLTKAFYIGVHEVTQEQYALVMGINPSQFKGARNPVEQVSWDEATEFCRKLSALPKERAAGRVYRLPTEAEWEYACRAGTTTVFSFGDDPASYVDFGWFYDNSSDHQPKPVGQKKPNRWGICDMHGNVYEWCQDWHGSESPTRVIDPIGPKTGSDKVSRGGGANGNAIDGQSGRHHKWSPNLRHGFQGFRVSLNASGIPKQVERSLDR